MRPVFKRSLLPAEGDRFLQNSDSDNDGYCHCKGEVKESPLVHRPLVAHCTSPGWQTREMEHLIKWELSRQIKILRETCPSAILSTTDPTRTDLELNQSLQNVATHLLDYMMSHPRWWSWYQHFEGTSWRWRQKFLWNTSIHLPNYTVDTAMRTSNIFYNFKF